MIIGNDQWVIEAQKFCGLSITHRWHQLLIDVIDYSLMTHRLLIVFYTAHDRHFSCFLVPFFFAFVILLSVLDAFFLVSGDPEDPALQEKGNELLHQSQIGGRNFRICSLKMALKALYKDSKYPSHGVIAEFAKLNNLDGATVKVWFNNKRQRDTGEPSEP